MRHVTLITTGGTIEKTYNDLTGELTNRGSVVRRMLKRLRLEDTQVAIVELLSKDSLHMTDDDRFSIVKALHACGADRPSGLNGPGGTGVPPLSLPSRGIVILHGTDTLTITGERILKDLTPIHVPVVLTGAMRPYEMVRSDALQNLTEAIFATGILPPGVYCAAHGRILPFPGVAKDRDRRTFVKLAP
jgi:L-asparaginase